MISLVERVYNFGGSGGLAMRFGEWGGGVVMVMANVNSTQL